MVVNGFKWDTERSDASDQPVSLPLVDLSPLMAAAYRLLDIGSRELPLIKAMQRV
jgi:hypothetical protein